MLYSVVFSEITIKGRNRNVFQNLLMRNIRSALGGAKIRREGGKLIIEADDAVEKLTKTFGIDYVKPCIETKPDIRSIREALSRYSFPGMSIKVQTKRGDKSFPLSSQQVNEAAGRDFVQRGSTVDLDSPDRTIYIDIMKERALLSVERFACPGGLPVGSSGRVLSMLSGGFDSPVASWLMMRRGCSVDFLHMHSLPDSSEVKRSKIMRIAEKLKQFHPHKSKLFIASYGEFYKKTLSLGSRYELVVFRRFLLRLGNEIARSHHSKALVTGDSLGQVASQTLDNLCTTDEASEIPVLRPLVAYTKQEIIDLCRDIGLYDESLQEYKDCCSLVAHKLPSTKVKLGAAKKLEERLDIGKILDRTIDGIEIIDL